jgi:hypothetical protein
MIQIPNRLKQLMTDYMVDTNTASEDPYSDTPFETYDRLRTWNNVEEVLGYAENAYRYLKRNGTATDEELRAAAIGNSHQKLSEGYWAIVAPLIATAENIEWHDSYSLSEDAPEHKSEEWLAEASKLDIPDSRRYSGIPRAVDQSYGHLQKILKRNDRPRPVHREELARNCGVHIETERYTRYVEEYLTELPGVVGPTEDNPPWEFVDTTEATTSANETGEASG